MVTRVLSLACVAVGLAMAVQAQQAPQVAQTLNGPTPGFFGRTVGSSSDYLVVGAPALPVTGEAYAFSRGATGWVGGTPLSTGLGIQAGAFGTAVAVDGNTIVVGDFVDGQLGFFAGAAYVFVREEGAWVLQQKLFADDANPNQQFGEFAAIQGDTCIIGTHTAGRVWVFERSGSTWTEVLALSGFGLGMGRAIDVDGDRLVVGLFADGVPGFPGSGTAMVYRRDPAGWVLEQRLVHDDVASGDLFGRGVALQGDSLIVGAPEKEEPGVYCGAAYVFRRSGTLWSQEAKLIATDGDQVRDFGKYVQLDGDLAACNQLQGRGGERTSAFYVFRRDGTTWDAGVKTTPPVSSGSEPIMALSGQRLLVGADADEQANLYVIPESPTTYCTAKTNSAGCSPQISTTGSPTFTGADDFVITANSVLPSKPGLFFFGLQSMSALPFLGGVLCVQPPLVRTPVQLSTAGVACEGTYAYAFQQTRMIGYGLLPGDRFFGQYWTRDRAHPDGTGVGLSDAVDVLVLP